MSSPTILDRSQPPPGGAVRPFRFPPFRRSRLANGLEILAARLPQVPLVNLEILSPAGAQYDPPGLAGLASLHGEILDEGTARRSALEIAERIEALGGSVTSGAGWNMAYVECGLLARHLEPGLELMAEIVLEPSFEEREIERLRQEREAEILRRQGQPVALADECFSAAVYDGTVYREPQIGTARSLERLTREALRDFYRRHMAPRGSTLIAVGDLDPEHIHTLADKLLGGWPQGSPPAPPAIAPRPLAGTEVHVVDRPGAAQTQLQIGHAGVPRGHGDYVTLFLLNAIYGGKFTSRINLNLRERHGYTYGAQSAFVRRQGPGPFLTRAAVATEVAGAAAGEILFEIRRLAEEPISAEELSETQDYLIGVFPYTVQTISDLSKRLEALTVFALGDDYYETYTDKLRAITCERVFAAAREHVHPDRLAVVAVGPAEELRPQFENLGPVDVHVPG